jgi:hypothetical protein
MTLSLKEKGEKHSEHRLGEGDELFGYDFFPFSLFKVALIMNFMQT